MKNLFNYLRLIYRIAFDPFGKALFLGMALMGAFAILSANADVFSTLIYFFGVLIFYPPTMFGGISVIWNYQRYRNRGFTQWEATVRGKRYIVQMPKASTHGLSFVELDQVILAQLKGQI